jgi:hypothetical protein
MLLALVAASDPGRAKQAASTGNDVTPSSGHVEVAGLRSDGIGAPDIGADPRFGVLFNPEARWRITIKDPIRRYGARSSARSGESRKKPGAKLPLSV